MPNTEPIDRSAQLISGLCLEAGRIMEDASPELAFRLPTETRAIHDWLDRARSAGEDIAKLIAAAEVLHRRYLEG